MERKRKDNLDPLDILKNHMIKKYGKSEGLKQLKMMSGEDALWTLEEINNPGSLQKYKKNNPKNPPLIEKTEIIKNKKKLSTIKNINTTIIYFLIDKDKIVYIGKSDKYLERIAHHSTNKEFDSYYIEHIPRERINKIEAKYIFKYAPKYNKMITSLPETKIRLIKQTTNTENKILFLNAVVLNNKLYINLESEDFDIYKQEEHTLINPHNNKPHALVISSKYEE